MQTNLTSGFRDSDLGQEAEAILRKCVHCGFCLATCPSYQILGDERDSPRGRIYLIKQMLEGGKATARTQRHLDQCLTCRNCETTCPSGVDYGNLIDIGREIVSQEVRRPFWQRRQRAVLAYGLNSVFFKLAVNAGQWVRPWLPSVVQGKLPKVRPAGRVPVTHYARKVILPGGCVQPTLMPSIDGATIRVLAAIGITALESSQKQCCGAVNFHLDQQEAALVQMRRNIDAWLPRIQSKEVEAIVVNASGCGAMIKEYAHHLRHDPAYRDKAQIVVDHVKDIAELVMPQAGFLKLKLKRPLDQRVAFHPPCTLQHWQKLRSDTESMLEALGFELTQFGESQMCCGAAGTYSVLNPQIAMPLRDRKLTSIQATEPEMIITSNMGCMMHLQSGTQTPVRHWVEALDQALFA